ncbi:Succinate--hydroxymethylglutarate CoA-transferase [Pseudocercospora fuligena]|uniref:Succinate--hydroxymethylglutarate CoA-transferase n=1 Tax=Pseudocercospora fuligena TaxID=685502 RepID=A0A8H6VIN1_9PEZI|nr:Succinate--hydroxymethylglutarate CoA-transferase [Pseudocercospora fuligena]
MKSMASSRAFAIGAVRSLTTPTSGTYIHASNRTGFSVRTLAVSNTSIRNLNSSASYRNSEPIDPNKTGAKLPLDGILVVSLEQAIAGPFCTRQLADLGARVIKVERPGSGDFNRYHDTRVKGLCSHFVWTNRSKESLALDLKQPSDLSALKKILEKADILVQNLAPRATERMGLDYQTLKTQHPSLIVCDISGYGSTGPYRNKKAYDLLIQAESGFLSMTGSPGAPAKSGISIADIAAGTTAFNNILAAIIQRSKIGEGCRLDVSMLESMAEWMSFPMYYAYDGAEPPKLAGAEHASIYPYGPFECKDGVVMLGMQNEREWGIFCEKVFGREELLKDERFRNTSLRSQNRKELKEIIEECFKSSRAEDVLEKLQSNGIANAKMTDMEGLWDHPQLKARGRWMEVETPNGSIPALKPAGAAEGLDVRMDRIPSVGEHSEAIFKEFGIER